MLVILKIELKMKSRDNLKNMFENKKYVRK